MKKFYIGFISLLTLCGGCKEKVNLVPVAQLYTVQADGVSVTTSYPGRTISMNSSEVTFRVSGVIEKLLVTEGQVVRKGQPIALLDARDYRTQLNATEAEYSQIKAQVDRVVAMHAEHAVSDNDYDKARYGLKQIEQKLAHHKAQLADCTLRAPYNGVIGKIIHDRGESILQGLPVISMFTDEGLDVVIDIPTSEYLRRDSFHEFEAQFAVLGNKSYPLQMVNVSKTANANQLYEMRLRVDGKYDEITPGMSTMVKISYKDQGESSILIPTQALFEKDMQSSVYCYNENDSCVHLRPVVVKDLRANGMAVIASGLSAGDRIVTAGVSKLQDGQKVKPTNIPSKQNVGGLI